MRKETINIDHRKKIFKAKLNGIGFKEGDSHIIYLPSLQLSSYGDTIKEANEMMKISLNEFSENLLELNENKINSILKELGWEKVEQTFIKNSFIKRNCKLDAPCPDVDVDLYTIGELNQAISILENYDAAKEPVSNSHSMTGDGMNCLEFFDMIKKEWCLSEEQYTPFWNDVLTFARKYHKERKEYCG
jgi:hypothetical protein